MWDASGMWDGLTLSFVFICSFLSWGNGKPLITYYITSWRAQWDTRLPCHKYR